MRPSNFLPLLAISACTSSPNDDVVGPFTGPVHRYVVDRFTLPLNNSQARDIGDDLDGDNHVDNEIGQTFGFLAGQNDLNKHSTDMIAAGALMSSIEIQADDLDNDKTVGVRYLGTPSTPFTIMGGVLEDGTFVSNRTATSRVLGAAELVLPVFADADPIHIPAYAMELSYTRLADGSLDVHVAGGIDQAMAERAIFDGLVQMIGASPRDHLDMMNIFDTDHNWLLTQAEVVTNNLVKSLLAPDVTLLDTNMYSSGAYGHDSVSFGFQLHAIACDDGNCTLPAISDHCGDRVLDGDETDVDCGGSCLACPGEMKCSGPADCQSQSCTPNGTCAAPSCSDGVLDGFESDLDCGAGCTKCANNRACFSGADCASGNCDHGFGTPGLCSPYPN